MQYKRKNVGKCVCKKSSKEIGKIVRKKSSKNKASVYPKHV